WHKKTFPLWCANSSVRTWIQPQESDSARVNFMSPWRTFTTTLTSPRNHSHWNIVGPAMLPCADWLRKPVHFSRGDSAICLRRQNRRLDGWYRMSLGFLIDSVPFWSWIPALCGFDVTGTTISVRYSGPDRIL